MKEQFVRDLKEGHKVLSFFLVKHKQLEYFRDRTRRGVSHRRGGALVD